MEKDSRSTEIIETTIGDLVDAITRVAEEAGQTEEEGYRIAAAALERLLPKEKRETFVDGLN
jgi:hypothetical protein